MRLGLSLATNPKDNSFLVRNGGFGTAWPPCAERSLQGACTSACKGTQNQMHVQKHVKACKYTSLCIFIYAVCTVGLRNLTFHGEKDAKAEDSLAKQQLKSGSFKPILDASFSPPGLQPSLVPRVRELLLHHGHVLPGQLQLQVLQDGGSSSAEYEKQSALWL